MAERIAVIGAGTMGHGIAQVAAQAGYPVAIHDSFPGALDKARKQVELNLAKGIEKGKVTEAERDRTLGNLKFMPEFEPAMEGVGLVIEAIIEDLEIKKKLFAQIDKAAPRTAILASNTSSLPIAGIAGAVGDPGRVIGMHFFNPVHVMKLVEVVVHDQTSARARDLTLEVAVKMGKQPIVVKDSPGFASSRLGVILGLEAMRMVEQGVASAEDIDKAMELGYNHPMGPLKLTDLVGLDVRLAIADHLHRELKGEQYRAPDILRRKVAAGELGKKTRKGFYTWDA